MGVALSHDLLRVSLCCSWLLCCKANFLFAIISKCHFYCSPADARHWETIECAMHACVIIPRYFFFCRTFKGHVWVSNTENHAEFCVWDCNAPLSALGYKTPRFSVIFIWDVYGTHLNDVSADYAWYYSIHLVIVICISTYFRESGVFCYRHVLDTV
jgi:hypothetical protein